MNRIAIDDGLLTTRVAVEEDGVLRDFAWEEKNQDHKLGSIYKGRVIDVLKSMDACLVEIGMDQPAYLGRSDMIYQGRRGQKNDVLDHLVKTGDEILVQLMRLPVEEKGAKVSMRLALTGKFLVFFPNQSHVGISRNIHDEMEKSRLLNWAKKTVKSGGLIIRTEAMGSAQDVLEKELSSLENTWNKLKNYKVLGHAPQNIYEGPDPIGDFIQKNIKKDTKIVCSDKQRKVWVEENIVGYDSKGEGVVKFYRENTPFFEFLGIEKALKNDLSHKVDLPKGGFLLVEETEACIIFDVNSGWRAGQKNLDETAYLVNRQAAKEISRLLKVRNLSGIILVDFIDMQAKEKKEKLVSWMKRCVREDTNRVYVYGLTQLGILEMTRKKTSPSILSRMERFKKREKFSYESATGILSIEKILQDFHYHVHHTKEPAILYGICSEGLVLAKKEKEKIAKYIKHTGKILFLTNASCENTKRLKTGTVKKVENFVKKAGYLECFHI